MATRSLMKCNLHRLNLIIVIIFVTACGSFTDERATLQAENRNLKGTIDAQNAQRTQVSTPSDRRAPSGSESLTSIPERPTPTLTLQAPTATAILATATSRPTPTSPPLLSPTPSTLLFSDNFDNGISPAWSRISLGYNMANGKLVNNGDIGVIWLGKRDWSDIVLDVDIENPGCGDNAVNIGIRMQDPKNFIAIVAVERCVFVTGGIARVTNGKYDKLLVTGTGRTGHWRIEVVGRVYKVSIDGQPLMSASDETWPSGSVGFSMGTGAVDNLAVHRYPP